MQRHCLRAAAAATGTEETPSADRNQQELQLSHALPKLRSCLTRSAGRPFFRAARQKARASGALAVSSLTRSPQASFRAPANRNDEHQS